jgi:predicted transcriptional regulator
MNYKATYFKLSENYEVTVNGSLNHTILRVEELKKAIEVKKDSIKPNQSSYNVNDPKKELEDLERKLSECSMQRFSQKDEENLNTHLEENSKDGWGLLKMETITRGVYYERNGIGYSFNAQEGFVIFWEK